MNQEKTILANNERSYLSWIWNVPGNRKSLLLALGISIGSFIIFKLLYPFPDFLDDSYSYIFAASAHLDISIWPIGYSKFLAAFHAITHSDTVLVAFTYFFVQIAAIHFYFTLLYQFNTSLWTRNVLFLFLFINPLTLYLSNTINSDAIFAAFSLFWITELIWTLRRPSTTHIISQAVLLFFCFTIRNNAYYYPIVAAIAMLMSNQSTIRKIAGIVAPLLLIIPFILYTENAAKKLIGTKEFSLFTGWQLANNALYIYDRIEIDSNLFVSSESKELNTMSTAFFKRVNIPVYHDYLSSYVGNFFVRQPDAPLKQYYFKHYKSNNELGSIITWGKASLAFEPFGKSIILNHPVAYIQYFMIPNAWHYFVPPLSHLEKYNYGGNTIDPVAQKWFDYSRPVIRAFSHDFQGFILLMYPAFFILINVMYIWNLFQMLIRKGLQPFMETPGKYHTLMFSFFTLNFAFSLAATANILRYQVVPGIVLLGSALLLSDTLETHSLNKKQIKVNIQDQNSAVNTKSQQLISQ